MGQIRISTLQRYVQPKNQNCDSKHITLAFSTGSHFVVRFTLTIFSDGFLFNKTLPDCRRCVPLSSAFGIAVKFSLPWTKHQKSWWLIFVT